MIRVRVVAVSQIQQVVNVVVVVADDRSSIFPVRHVAVRCAICDRVHAAR